VTELTDFLDAEYGLQRGEKAWRESALEAGAELMEDLRLGPQEMRRKLVADRGMRLLAVKHWLRVARKGTEVLPGTAMDNGFRVIGVAAALGGLLLGLGTGRAALSSPAGEPVNLWLCLGVLVLLQVGFLLSAVLAVCIAKSRGRQWLSAFSNVLQWLHRWSWAKRIHSSELLQAMPRTQKVERWLWLGLTQRFAVFFNLGALLMFVAMLLFTELQFGWATTPTSIGADHMQVLVNILAAPWGWAFPPSWVPDRILIEGTQWDSLAVQFRSVNADGRAWWPFVMMNILLWGLMPRLLLMRWAANGKNKELRGLDWNHRRLQDLFEVMLPPTVVTAATPGVLTPNTTITPTISSANCVMISWGDWNSSLDLQAGSRDLSADKALLLELAKRTFNTIQILVEAGEAPDKRLTSFLAQMRGEVGPACLIQVCPIEVASTDSAIWRAPSARDLLIWRRTLANLHDDHLHVSAMAPTMPGGV